VRTRLADEGGFTLVELLVAMIIGLIVMFAALVVMDGSWRLQDRTADTIDATDRGRLAMDRITQQLDGRVCVPATTAPVLAPAGALVTATDNQIEFYASVTSDTAPRLVVERRRLTYRPASKDILLETWRAAAAPPVRPPATTATPTATKIVAEGVGPATGASPPPVFAYYAFQGVPRLATLKVTPPMTTAQLDSVALVKIDFVSQGKQQNIGTEFQNDSLTRSPTSCL
jgi:prepilin-type N-terminal cleavage/methylation domain-containing protein